MNLGSSQLYRSARLVHSAQVFAPLNYQSMTRTFSHFKH